MTSRLRIVVGSDDAGYEYKEALKGDLAADSRVAEVTDVGVGADEDTAYPHVAVAAARMVAEGKADRALLVCGTGLAWRSAPTKCRESAPSPRTTASPSNARCCRTTPRCCASANASSAWNWPADSPANGSTTSSTRPANRPTKWRRSTGTSPSLNESIVLKS